MRLKEQCKRRLLTGRLARLAREMVANTPCVQGDRTRVILGEQVVLGDALLNVWSGTITLQRFAFLGSGVSLLTGTHDPSRLNRERQLAVPTTGRDIVIGEGAWLASNVTVLGPCRIGAHAVVAAGSLVRYDVDPYEMVAGVPARHIGWVKH